MRDYATITATTVWSCVYTDAWQRSDGIIGACAHRNRVATPAGTVRSAQRLSSMDPAAVHGSDCRVNDAPPHTLRRGSAVQTFLQFVSSLQCGTHGGSGCFDGALHVHCIVEASQMRELRSL